MEISIITATFNWVDTVAEELASVQVQRWPQMEHIVIDGALTDRTLPKSA